jgi:hypothetical protein
VEDVDGGVERLEGEFVIAGVVVRKDGQVVSGLGRESLSVGSWAEIAQNGVVTFEVDAVGVDGARPVDLETVSVTVVDDNGQVYGQVEEAGITGDGKLVARFAPYRVGSGKMTVDIHAPGIEVDGEAFETTMKVHFEEGGGAPPAVVVPEGVEADQAGWVAVTMYNLLSPPAEKDVERCVMKIGEAEVSHDVAKSRLVQPDQKIMFKVDGKTGPASVKCDGKDAVILGGDGAASFDVPEPGSGPTGGVSGAAATTKNATDAGSGGVNGDAGASGVDVNATLAVNSLEPPLEERKGKVRMGSQIRVVSADPSTYSVNEAADVLEALCFFTEGSNCSLTKVTKGSAILDVESYVTAGTENKALDKLRTAVETCEFQKRIGISDCNEIQLNESTVLASSAVTADDTSSVKKKRGVSALAVGLSAAAGGIALILLIVAAVWVVYRRNAEQMESDFSSSGPLGVPENDESLYQQAIVRDIYGRGDFTGGIPMEEVAEQSRREAELRDTMLRPPSSSGGSSFLSPPTEEASSTYSV